MQNLITDVPGVLVGNADDRERATGVSVVLFEEAAAAAVSILGGAPGVRDTALLEPEMTVETVDAIVLSGGSAFGLDAAGGVMAVLVERGRGFRVGDALVPIVPQAILFDLLNGGDKAWGRKPPFFDLGAAACEAASAGFRLGTAGAGYGATTATLKGGLGSASAVTESGFVVGALVAVNAVGTATMGEGPHFWAAPYEQNAEFGGIGWPYARPKDALVPRLKGGPGRNTTIAVVATDARLGKAQAKRIANAAHDGLARALRPAHTPLDGDIVFAAGTGRREVAGPMALNEIAMAASDVLARAVARGVYEATALPYPGALPAWKDRFGRIMVSP
ncbi:P1 family peptidase [Alsobacter sp. SYSU M60028]|uniref:P1 family peptidase n=1 Tax=Alsobacter ponti TaxID=2962936 RepID=A0ABT1LG56_9HYPH|nr:P1 family peptidase [Alsobacter ponti]MCP8940419.1 P1 family peptidase [Alsobacter ponti]